MHRQIIIIGIVAASQEQTCYSSANKSSTIVLTKLKNYASMKPRLLGMPYNSAGLQLFSNKPDMTSRMIWSNTTSAAYSIAIYIRLRDFDPFNPKHSGYVIPVTIYLPLINKNLN